MEKEKKEYQKALEKINTINDYLMVLATIYALLSFTFEGYDLSIYGLLSLVYDTFSSEWFLYIFFGDMGARFLFFHYKIKKFKISLFSSIPFGVGWLYTKYHLKKMKN